MTDIRTILLGKIKPPIGSEYNELFGNHKIDCVNNYITLGNYDAMMIYPLDKYNEVLGRKSSSISGSSYCLDSIFEEKKLITEKYIKDNINRENSSDFYHPFHIIKHIPNDDVEKLENFWTKKSRCIAITIIYRKINSSLIDFETKFKDTIADIAKQNKVDYYEIYRTINISELIVITKDDSLRQIMEFISKINISQDNIYTHTICGFEYSYILNHSCNKITETDTTNHNNSSNNESSNTDPVTSNDIVKAEGNNVETAVTVKKVDDIIPFVKISGTIKSHKEANECFKNINSILNKEQSEKTDYLAFGNNDFNLIYKSVNSERIIKLLYEWMNSNEENRAFSNIKTRIHLEYSNTIKNGIDLEQTVIEHKSTTDMEDWAGSDEDISYIKRIIDFSIRNVYCYIQYDWALPFIETLNMFSDMCNNIALSRVKYFVADSLLTFSIALNKLYCEYANNNDIDGLKLIIDKNEKVLNQYTTGFESLINQLIRVDGYISQEPGYSPLVYYMIPASVLGYYSSFIYSLIELLARPSSNSPNHCKYSMLLIPSLEKRIQIDDVLELDYRGKQPFFPQYQVYLVQTPYKKLYQPESLLFAITHEIMHFCGEEVRCREVRYKAILSFVAEYFVTDFDIISNSNNVADYLFDFLSSRIKYSQDGVYLNVLEKKLQDEVASIYQNSYLKNTLFSIYYTDTKNQKKKRRNRNKSADDERFDYNQKYNAINIASSETRFLGANITEAISLFRECYADLMTMIVLGSNVNEYLSFIFDEIDLIPDNNDQKYRLCSFTQRIALVIYTLSTCSTESKKDKYRITCVADEKHKAVIARINEIISLLNDATSRCTNYGSEIIIGEELFPLKCLLTVFDYLTRCYKTYMELSNNGTVFQSIANKYSLLKDNINLSGDDFFAFIHKNRERIDNMIEYYSQFI